MPRAPSGVCLITTVAGSGVQGPGGDGGQATATALNIPSAVAVDSGGNLFIGEAGDNRVRAVNLPSGLITTVAGSGTAGYGGDGGLGPAAALNSPLGLAVDSSGNLFVADTGNQRIREVASTAAAVSFSPLGTATTIAAPATAVYGQPITLTAAVATDPPGSVTPSSGTVTFMDGKTALGTAVLSGGAATLTTAALAGGTHALQAVYHGFDDCFSGSSSTLAANVSISTASTATALTASAATLSYGQVLTLTARVAAAVPSGATPIGTVLFFDGTTVLGTAALAGGIAVFATPGLAVGSHSLSADYLGSRANLAASSTPLATTVTMVAMGTTTTLALSATNAVYGQPVTFTATVTPIAPTTATPGGGTITFLDGSTVLATLPLSGGGAACTTSSLAVGSHPLSAAYSGDGINFLSSSSTGGSVVLTVNPDPLTVPPQVIAVNSVQNMDSLEASGSVQVTVGAGGQLTVNSPVVLDPGGSVSVVDGGMLVRRASTRPSARWDSTWTRERSRPAARSPPPRPSPSAPAAA